MATSPWAGLTHDAISNQLLTEAGRICNNIFYKQSRNVDQWYRSFFGQTDFPKNMGYNPTYPVYQSTVPAGPVPMTQIGPSDCEQPYSPCDPGFWYVPNLGITQKTMTLYQTPIMRTTDICFDDLNLDWNPDQYMNMRVDNLIFQTKWTWSYMGLNALLTGPITKVVAAPYANNTLPTTIGVSATNPWAADAIAQSLPTVEPTVGLSSGIFVQAYRSFQDQGLAGNNENQPGRQPQFDAFGDPTDFLTLTVNDPAFRQDTRFTKSADGLRDGIPAVFNLQSLGQAMGFNFHPLTYPPRFTFANGEYTQVQPFNSGVATTRGTIQNTTQAYQDAPISGVFLVAKRDAFQWRIPDFSQRFGKATFGPNNYAGEFAWRSYYTDNNVMMNKGFFVSQIKAGWDFPFPERIWLVLYLRCGVATATTICGPDGQPTCSTPNYPDAPAPSDPTPYVNPCTVIPYSIP